jgi:hypothetical protein
MKLPLIYKVLFFSAILYGSFGLYWGNRFSNTYSRQQTEAKKYIFIEHGNTYYVNEAAYKKAKFIRKSSWIWFIIVWVTIFLYVRKKQPNYFTLKNR